MANVAGEETGIVTPIKLAHVVFRTSRYDELVAWYKLVLNATAAYENDSLAFLSYDEEHHRIAVVHVPGLNEQPAAITGMHHIAFAYQSLHDLMRNYARLRNLGIVPIWAINHGPTTSLYYADPDGNQLEFQVDNFDTVEEATRFFYTDAFSVNPIGVDFDPDALYSRLLAGEDEEELKRRPVSGPRGVESIKIR